MPEKDESHPEVIRMYTRKIIYDHRGIAIQVRMALQPDDLHRTAINIEGHTLYREGVRAVHTALSLLTTEGVSTIDPRQVRALMEGIENYLTGRE